MEENELKRTQDIVQALLERKRTKQLLTQDNYTILVTAEQKRIFDRYHVLKRDRPEGMSNLGGLGNNLYVQETADDSLETI
jgi:hypothetical protein